MSIQSEIDRITAARDDIATAISEKGVTVENNNIDGLADKVRQISQGSNTRGVYEITFPTDTSAWVEGNEPVMPGEVNALRWSLSFLSYTCISGPEHIEYGSVISNIYLKDYTVWTTSSNLGNKKDNAYFLSISNIMLKKSNTSLSYYDSLSFVCPAVITGTYIIETENIGYDTTHLNLYRPRSSNAPTEVSNNFSYYYGNLSPISTQAVGDALASVIGLLVREVRGIALASEWSEDTTSGGYYNVLDLYYYPDETPITIQSLIVSPTFAVQTDNTETNKTLASVLAVINNGYFDDNIDAETSSITISVSEKIETDIELAWIVISYLDIENMSY